MYLLNVNMLQNASVLKNSEKRKILGLRKQSLHEENNSLDFIDAVHQW